MPTRYLKPGIRDSERINALSAEAEVLYYRLIVTVDDFGRSDARPNMLKASCFPVRESATPKRCAEWLAELSKSGLIVAYEHHGKPYLQMQRWDNQPRARESKFPSPEDGCIQVHADARIPRTLLPGTGTGTGTGTENRKPEPTTGTDIAPGSSPRTRAAPTGETWKAYADAYQDRYGTPPVRNAKVNGQLAQLVARLGADEAPAVARFYLGHQSGLYVSSMHATDLLLRDAEKLRTEWATGRKVTRTSAMMADRTQTNHDAFAPMLAEARAREALGG